MIVFGEQEEGRTGGSSSWRGDADAVAGCWTLGFAERFAKTPSFEWTFFSLTDFASSAAAGLPARLLLPEELEDEAAVAAVACRWSSLSLSLSSAASSTSADALPTKGECSAPGSIGSVSATAVAG